jgi:hypothetical protein
MWSRQSSSFQDVKQTSAIVLATQDVRKSLTKLWMNMCDNAETLWSIQRRKSSSRKIVNKNAGRTKFGQKQSARFKVLAKVFHQQRIISVQHVFPPVLAKKVSFATRLVNAFLAPNVLATTATDCQCIQAKHRQVQMARAASALVD